MKSQKQNSQLGFSIIVVLAALVVVSGTGLAGWRIHSAKESKKRSIDTSNNGSGNAPGLEAGGSPDVSQAQKAVVKVPAANGQTNSVTLNPALFYELKISDQRYFGKVNKINDNYIRLSEVIYFKGARLARLGSELHGPEPVMYISTKKIQQLSELNPTQAEYSPVLQAAKDGATAGIKDAFPSGAISNYIKQSQYQGVFLDDGKTYFGKLKGFNGNFLAAAPRVYTLRTDGASGTSGTMTSLVVAGADQVNKYTEAQLLFWENLRSDGQISSAINQFENQR